MSLNAALSRRVYSITNKTIVWISLFYTYYIFNTQQNEFIAKSVSDVVIRWIIFSMLLLFVLVGLYITIILMFGNENDMDMICQFILDNHVAIMIAILVVR